MQIRFNIKYFKNKIRFYFIPLLGQKYDTLNTKFVHNLKNTKKNRKLYSLVAYKSNYMDIVNDKCLMNFLIKVVN